MFWLPVPTGGRPGSQPSNHLAPAFTPAEARIGILGVCPRLQQRDCLRFARSSSQHQHRGMFDPWPQRGKGIAAPNAANAGLASDAGIPPCKPVPGGRLSAVDRSQRVGEGSVSCGTVSVSRDLLHWNLGENRGSVRSEQAQQKNTLKRSIQKGSLGSRMHGDRAVGPGAPEEKGCSRVCEGNGAARAVAGGVGAV